VVSEQMEESLRREIESYVETRLSRVKQEIAQLQTQLNETLKRILEGEGEAEWDGSLAATIAEHLRAAHDRGVELAASESSRTQASSDMAIVKAAIEEIEGQTSQSDILKTLVNRASSFAPRVVFFVIKGDQVRGWRGRGLQGTVGDDAVQQIAFALSADTMISEVVRSRATWSGTPNSQAENYQVLDRLSEQAPQRIVAVPLVVRGKPVAVLYADSAALDADAINLEALETLVRVAGMAVGLLSVSHGTAARAQVGAPAAAPEETHAVEEIPSAVYTPVRVYDDEPATPIAEPGAAVEQPVDGVAEPVEAIVEPEPAAVPVEAVTAEEPAVHVSETPASSFADTIQTPVVEPEPEPASAQSFSTPAPAPAAGTRRRYGSYDAELPVAVSDDEEKRQHNDARRFARLLVSEIKLYNEQKVIEGRAAGNLYERLREYIDRSREMYDKRVKGVVSSKYDYFHHELVNTLAEGDASKLGEAYPGTTVSA
jgi:hypothetical protein